MQESFTYFKIFKLTSWGKRPAERRRRFIQRFPRIIPDASRSPAKYCGAKHNDVRSYKFSRGRMIQCLQVDAMAVSLRIVFRTFRSENCSVFQQNLSDLSLRGAQRRSNLKVEGVASRGEAREHEAKRNTYHKKQEICCIVSRPLSPFQGSVSFRATIVRYGMTNRSVKDCRVGRTRPPRNDKFGRFCGKTEQIPERNV